MYGDSEREVDKDRIIQRHRIQLVEEERDDANERFLEVSHRLESTEKTLRAAELEVTRLKGCLDAVRTDQALMRKDLEKQSRQEAAEFLDATTRADVSAKLQTLSQQIEKISDAKTQIAAEMDASKKEMETAKNELAEKERERKALELRLADAQKQDEVWRNWCQDKEKEKESVKQIFSEKMSKWYEKERDLVRQLTEAKRQRDGLQTALEKKQDSLRMAHGKLKNTTDAFGRCVAALKQYEERGAPKRKADTDAAGPSQPMKLQYAKVPETEHLGGSRGRPELEGAPDFSEMTNAALKEKHLALIEKFNQEIRAGLIDEMEFRNLRKSYEGVATQKRVLAFELAELNKLLETEREERAPLELELAAQKKQTEKLQKQREADNRFIQSLEMTNEDFGGQVTFLVKHSASLNKMLEGQEGAMPLMPNSASRHQQPMSVHDIVENNRHLTRRNYNLDLDVKALQQELEELRRERGNLEEEANGDDPALESQKRPAIGQPTSAKNKKQKTLTDRSERQQDVGGSDWKEKWEQAVRDLSSARAAHEELEARLRQEVEAVQAKNAVLEKEMQGLERSLMEYRTKYDSALEQHKLQGQNFAAQLEAASRRVRELEAGAGQAAAEADSLRREIAELHGRRQMDAAKLKQEKKAFDEIQGRMILMESAHVREMDELRNAAQGEHSQDKDVADHAMDTDGSGLSDATPALRAVQELKLQLTEKEAMISGLTKSLETAADGREMAALELRAQLTTSQSALADEREKNKMMETAVAIAETERDQAVHEFRQKETEFDTARQTLQVELEMTRAEIEGEVKEWKRKSEISELQHAELQEQFRTMQEAHAKTMQDLRAHLNRVDRNCKQMSEELTRKSRELKESSESNEALRSQLDAKTKEITKMEEEKKETQQKDATRALAAATSLPALENRMEKEIEEHTTLASTVAKTDTMPAKTVTPLKSSLLTEVQETAADPLPASDLLGLRDTGLMSSPVFGRLGLKTSRAVAQKESPQPAADVQSTDLGQQTTAQPLEEGEVAAPERPVGSTTTPSTGLKTRTEIAALLETARASFKQQPESLKRRALGTAPQHQTPVTAPRTLQPPHREAGESSEAQKEQDGQSSKSPAGQMESEAMDEPEERRQKWVKIEYNIGGQKEDRGDGKRRDRGPKQ